MYLSSMTANGPTSTLDRDRRPAYQPRRFGGDHHDGDARTLLKTPFTLPTSTLSGATGNKDGPTPSPTRQQPLTSPLYTSPYGGAGSPGYRFASIERLVQRQKIYEGPPNSGTSSGTTTTTTIVTSKETTRETLSLSAKREQFFRQDGSGTTPAALNTSSTSLTTSTTPTNTVVNSLSGINLNSKESLYNRDKDSPVISSTRDMLRDRERESSIKDIEGFVGFANLPNQVYRKAVKKGFEFTLMVVGETGLGKSTLVNSMFLTDVYSNEYPGPSHRIKKTVQVETSKVLLKENGVNLTLTIVDTPGFGYAFDNSECWQPISDYIDSKYEEYLNAETRVHRTSVPDTRVHCCLYFIAPSGHGLKPLDIEVMKRLHDRVNIIPLIGRADTLTPEECSQFKRTILNEIAQNKIKIYEFPDCDDEEENKVQKPLKERVPFAVVGSTAVVEVNGKRVRGRKYPWGVAEVENMDHSDFIALRNMLIRTHMQDLKDVTNNVHYENYRCRKLAGIGADGKPATIANKNPLAQMEEEKKENEARMKRMEQEMEQVFEMKVREKMQKLKDSEADLQRRHEQMKAMLEQQRIELEEKRRAFEKEKANFELANKDVEDALRRMSLDTNSKEHLDGREKKKEKKKGLF